MSAEPFDSICLDIMYTSGTNCVDSVRWCVSQRKWCVPNDVSSQPPWCSLCLPSMWRTNWCGMLTSCDSQCSCMRPVNTAPSTPNASASMGTWRRRAVEGMTWPTPGVRGTGSGRGGTGGASPEGPAPPPTAAPPNSGASSSFDSTSRRVDASVSRRHRSHDVEEAQRVVSLGEGEGDAVLLELEHGGDLHACHLLLPHVLLPFLYGMQRRDAWYDTSKIRPNTRQYRCIMLYCYVFDVYCLPYRACI